MPPLNIRVRDHRTFGRKPVVGRHVLKAPDKSEPLSAAEAAPEPSKLLRVLLKFYLLKSRSLAPNVLVHFKDISLVTKCH